MHTNSKLLFEKHVKPLLKAPAKVLEIGPDQFPSTFERVCSRLSLEWHTLDLHDHPSLTYADSRQYSFAIPDNTYDVVLSGQVIEHVRKPWKWLPELARVALPGGLVVTINPLSWIYHEAPVDCWRIYPEGMRALYEEAGLDVLLSCWESLETPHYRRYQPGVSREWQSPRKRFIYKMLGRFGFPVERSYDTVTIGRKS